MSFEMELGATVRDHGHRKTVSGRTGFGLFVFVHMVPRDFGKTAVGIIKALSLFLCLTRVWKMCCTDVLKKVYL